MAFVIVGAPLQTSTFHVSQNTIGRVITSSSTGIGSSTVPMYQSELGAKEKRGRLILTESLFFGTGIVLAVCVRMRAGITRLLYSLKPSWSGGRGGGKSTTGQFCLIVVRLSGIGDNLRR
jgi:hypothetical protein